MSNMRTQKSTKPEMGVGCGVARKSARPTRHRQSHTEEGGHWLKLGRLQLQKSRQIRHDKTYMIRTFHPNRRFTTSGEIGYPIRYEISSMMKRYENGKKK
jgi:hypothetical protein